MKRMYNTGKLARSISNKLKESIFSVIYVLDLLEFESPQELTKEEIAEWTERVNEVFQMEDLQ